MSAQPAVAPVRQAANNDSATAAAGASQTPMEATKPEIRAKNPMTSTWLSRDPSTWDWAQRFLHNVGAVQISENVQYPKSSPTDPVPYFPIWKQHLWIFPRAFAPLVGHWAIVKTFGSFHPVAAFLYYSVYFIFFALKTLALLRTLSEKYGFFDSDKARDGIPDLHGAKVFWSLIGTTTIRPLFAIFVAYDRHEVPTLTWWALPFQMALYAAVLDFFFYVYHRAMHEVPWLWKFHRLHHTTKHPQAALSPYADNIQEWGDILVIPLLTYLVLRPNFATWWMSTAYILFTEAMGHSGIRLYWPTPLTGDFLKPFDADLALEDHDLHHRRGWKKATNYGKQTRLWDVIFGTSGQRVEGKEANIDYVNTASPW